MNHPSLSVCITNYNHAQYVSEALESVLVQSLPPTEIIVVDDASTDNSIEVIRDFVKRYKNIRFIKNPYNQGCLYSMNRAFAEVKGDYVSFVAADDKVLPGFFEKSIIMLEKYPEAGMCVTYPRFIDAQGNFIKCPSFHSHETHVDIRTACFLSPHQMLSRLKRQPWFIGGIPPILFRYSALVDAGVVIPELELLADWFAVHFVALKYGICYIPEPLIAFRVLPNSFGTNIARQPKLSMGNHARALRLMQEPKYRKVFPKSFIDSQRRNFTYTSFRGGFVNWQHNFLEELRSLVPPLTLLDKVLVKFIYYLILFQRVVLKLYCYHNIAPILIGNSLEHFNRECDHNGVNKADT